MTNTKEYNEAVEVLARLFFIKVGEENKAPPLSVEQCVNLVKTAIDALGIEIVSRENLPKEGDRIINTNTGSHLWFDGSENHTRIASSKSNVIVCRNYKPAVYLETIKENAGKNEYTRN